MKSKMADIILTCAKAALTNVIIIFYSHEYLAGCMHEACMKGYMKVSMHV